MLADHAASSTLLTHRAGWPKITGTFTPRGPGPMIMDTRLGTAILLGFLLLGASGTRAGAATLTFGEGLVPVGTRLDGTSAYSELGLSFENATLIHDFRFVEDEYGITNGPGEIAAVLFSSPVDAVRFRWVTAVFDHDFYGTAYDARGAVVDRFTFRARGDLFGSTGIALLSGPGITRFEFHDSGSRVGLDRLAIGPSAVPEPAAGLLLGAGALAAVRRRRHTGR